MALWTVHGDGKTVRPGEAVAPLERLSWPRTVGMWLGALFTLSIFSYLYRDNVFYKITESVIVGVSAGYYMVAGFWDSVVRDLLVNLLPDLARMWAVPSVEAGRVGWVFNALDGEAMRQDGGNHHCGDPGGHVLVLCDGDKAVADGQQQQANQGGIKQRAQRRELMPA